MEFDANKQLTATGDWSRANRCPWRQWPRQQPDSCTELWTASTLITWLSQVPQIRPLADIVHFKYSHTYLNAMSVLGYIFVCLLPFAKP